MTDTPNIGLKKYGATDSANLISGYNASMDTLDTVIKQAQDDIVTTQNSVEGKVNAGTGTNASINQMSSSTQLFGIYATTSNGHRVALIVKSDGLVVYDWDKEGGAGPLWST